MVYNATNQNASIELSTQSSNFTSLQTTNFTNLQTNASTNNTDWQQALNASYAPLKKINGLQPEDVLSSLAYQTQDFPLRVDITIHIRDLIPMAVVSGMVVIFLCSLPFLLYTLRKHL